MAKKLVWLNVETGKFSNSWDEDEFSNVKGCSREELISEANNRSNGIWKLIEFECLNDEDFEFMNLMVLK